MAAKVVLPSCTKLFFCRQFSNKLPAVSKNLHANSRIIRFSSSYSRSFSETVGKIKEALATKHNDTLGSKTTRLFVGTGQYYEHETNERVVILSLGDDENTRPPLLLHDTTLQRDEVDKLEHELTSLVPAIGSVHSGELDSVQDSPWKFGFVLKPSFSIFSASGFCCQLRHSGSGGRYFRIFGEDLHEDVPLSDIEHVQVSLSPEPWEERKLQLKMKNGDVVSIVEDLEENVSNEDGLASLMLTTEWMVKAGAHICVIGRQFGDNKVTLKLPSVLRADVNPWVAMRNRIWAEKGNES